MLEKNELPKKTEAFSSGVNLISPQRKSKDPPFPILFSYSAGQRGFFIFFS